jgi:hypothetical protein
LTHWQFFRRADEKNASLAILYPLAQLWFIDPASYRRMAPDLPRRFAGRVSVSAVDFLLIFLVLRASF